MNSEEVKRRLANGEDALELSIEKWKDIVEGRGGDFHGDNCGLCYTYDEIEEMDDGEYNTCIGCPVKMRTGKSDCMSTPWMTFAAHNICCGLCDSGHDGDSYCPDALEIAKEELAFLESLRTKP